MGWGRAGWVCDMLSVLQATAETSLILISRERDMERGVVRRNCFPHSGVGGLYARRWALCPPRLG